MKDEHEDAYDSVFDRVFRRIVDREAEISRQQSAAGQLLEELTAQTLPTRRLLLVSNSPRFHNLFLCELLIEKAREAAFQDADQSFELARLAVAIAESLRSESCGGSTEVR